VIQRWFSDVFRTSNVSSWVRFFSPCCTPSFGYAAQFQWTHRACGAGFWMMATPAKTTGWQSYWMHKKLLYDAIILSVFRIVYIGKSSRVGVFTHAAHVSVWKWSYVAVVGFTTNIRLHFFPCLSSSSNMFRLLFCLEVHPTRGSYITCIIYIYGIYNITCTIHYIYIILYIIYYILYVIYYVLYNIYIIYYIYIILL
jgi:hypothetical protein